MDTCLAAGNGLPWATGVRALEEAFHPHTVSTRLLYRIVIEFEFARPTEPMHAQQVGRTHWFDPWATFLRVHLGNEHWERDAERAANGCYLVQDRGLRGKRPLRIGGPKGQSAKCGA